jgi:CubicO group peptidase (beta-lactamase class C family)
MHRHIRWALVFGLAVFGLVAPAAQQQASIDARVAAALDRHHLAGAVAIAVNKSAVMYRQAFGVADSSTGTRMTPDVIFRIASMTKPVTSVAAMQLVEQGRVSLDDPAAKYLSEFQNVFVFDSFTPATGSYSLRPAKRPVTVRHLLTHTSGLAYNFTSETIRDFKPRAGETPPVGPLIFDPGERWHYGTSTDWVGRLVERVSGQTLERYFAEHVLDPLGMHDTFFNVPADKRARVLTAYRLQADGTLVPQPAPVVPVTEFNGGGGLFSTADDYARFVRMILNGGTLNGARILSAASIAAMSQNQIGAIGVPALETALPERSADFTFIEDGRDKWGLGFLIASNPRSGKRSPGSLSWGGIYNTHFWIDPRRGIGGILLMQYLPFADPSALDVLDAFERGVYQSLH